MDRDWILSIWTRHHRTLDDTSITRFRQLLFFLRHERDLEKRRKLTFRVAALHLLAKKVEHLYTIFALIQHFRSRAFSALLQDRIKHKILYHYPWQNQLKC